MINQKITLKTFFYFFLFFIAIENYAQCNLNEIKASSYFLKECNGMVFQSAIGALSPIYGNCGGLRFDSPLFSGGIFTNTMELDSKDYFSIFPNPARDFLYINTSSQKNFNISIYSQLGMKLVQEINSKEIPIQYLPDGFYMIIITDESKNIKLSRSFIKH
jgi:hypothetical protein